MDLFGSPLHYAIARAKKILDENMEQYELTIELAVADDNEVKNCAGSCCFSNIDIFNRYLLEQNGYLREKVIKMMHKSNFKILNVCNKWLMNKLKRGTEEDMVIKTSCQRGVLQNTYRTDNFEMEKFRNKCLTY